MKSASFAPLLLSLLVSACASYSGIHTEAVQLDATKLGARASNDAAANAGAAATEWPQSDWWKGFDDATLDRLIEAALSGNPDLQQADARLRRAHAVAGIVDSMRYPQVGLGASTTRERYSENGLIPPPYAGTVQTVNDLTLKASWELDFFGRNSEAVKAAVGELRASEADHQAARILIATDVARNYYALARLQSLRALSEQLNRQRSELLALERQRVAAGVDAPGELDPLKGSVEENQRDTAAIDAQIALSRHALAALLGRGPEATADLQATLAAANHTELPNALPLALLGHRADIVAAKWRVESNLHGLESAKAMFYPNINLSGFFGLSSIGFSKFLEAGSRQPGIGLALSLPIFDADRLRNEYRGFTAQTDIAIASYNKTLIGAYRDVADQLSTLQALDIQLQRQRNAVASAASAHALAQQRYAAGISNARPALAAEAGLLQQQSQLIELQGRWVDARIQLIHALGGGFAETAPQHDSGKQQASENKASENGGHHG